MYTYVQPGCKKENMATYVHTGGVSNAYSHIRTARARVHGWVGTEKIRCRRVHGEATECVVFIGRQRNAWEPIGLDGTGDGNEAWRTAERRNDLVFDQPRSKWDPVHQEGCGVPQNGTPRDTVHLHRRPPPASTGYCSSTVDLLQPPPATVHPRAAVHPTSIARSSIGYCSTSPLHGGPVQPPLHGLLFI